ncbi:MAG: HAD hydrolase-like protein, partial [Fibrobacteres bacterium]|nr:HAD hydrolase-like protein [Fibrobacterota bacterium]
KHPIPELQLTETRTDELNPTLWDTISKQLNVAKDEMLFISDSPSDIAQANQAQIKSIALGYTASERTLLVYEFSTYETQGGIR